ncbi:hypothetical protein D3C81_993060 [compost metagenome]
MPGVRSAWVDALRTSPAACCTACGSIAASRPQAKARWFIATAAPLSSTARISDSSDSGTSPCCQAKPRMNRLEAIASPSSAVASWVASSRIGSRPPNATFTPAMMSAAGNCMSGCVVKVPGIASYVLSTTCVRSPRTLDSAQ